MWVRSERIPSWQGQEGRRSLPFLWSKGWRWALILGVPFSLPSARSGSSEFAYLFTLDRSKWPRCLLWHGWLPGLNGSGTKDPWTTSIGDLASFHLERCHGAYPADFDDCWTPPDYWDADDIALEMTDHPYVWTDGSREDFSSVCGFEVAGAGVYLPASELALKNLVWRMVEEYGDPS